MKKFKLWLCKKFLPEWCREDMIKVNARLSDDIAARNNEIQQLKSYIDGMHYALQIQSKFKERG